MQTPPNIRFPPLQHAGYEMFSTLLQAPDGERKIFRIYGKRRILIINFSIIPGKKHGKAGRERHELALSYRIFLMMFCLVAWKRVPLTARPMTVVS